MAEGSDPEALWLRIAVGSGLLSQAQAAESGGRAGALARHWCTPAEAEAVDRLLDGVVRRGNVSQVRADAPTSAPTLISGPAGGDAVEQQWGPYTVIEELGSGGMAIVYRARHEGLQREFALKVIRKGFGESKEAIARFRLEAQAAAALGDYPGIVAAHDVGEAHGRLYLVMDLVDGRPFDEVLQAGDCGYPQIAGWCAEAARAVHHAHTRGMLHRDLKPANLLINAEGHLRLTDFGLARLHESTEDITRLTQAGALLGTPSYMSPEQARGEALDRRADVYSLGATLFHGLTGRAPFLGDATELILFKVLNEAPAAPSKLVPDVPPALEVIALRCLEKRPEDRYQSAGELADDLERFVRGEAITARRRSVLSRAGRWLAQRKVAAGVVATTVAAAGVGGGAIYLQEWRARTDAQLIAARAEGARADELEGRVAARPHIDAARAALARMDRLRMTPDWTAEQLAALAAEAHASLDAALDLQPGDPTLLFDVARTHALAGDDAAYAAQLERVVTLHPGFAPARLERAISKLERYESLNHRRDDLTERERAEAAALRSAIDADITAAGAHHADDDGLTLADGMRRFVDGEYGPAAERLNAFALRAVSDARAWYWAGHAWRHVPERNRDAMHALSQSLRFRPRYRPALELRALAMATHNSVTAGNDRETLAKMQPHSVEAWLELARTRARAGDRAGALAACDHILGVHPDNVEVLRARAMQRFADGALNDALADLNNAVRLAPDDFDARCQRSMLRAQTGDHNGALEDADRAIALRPQDSRGWQMRGMTHLQVRQFQLALDDYTRSLAFKPDAPDTLYFRGIAREGLRDFLGSVADFEAALQAAPPDWGLRAKTVRRRDVARVKSERR